MTTMSQPQYQSNISGLPGTQNHDSIQESMQLQHNVIMNNSMQNLVYQDANTIYLSNTQYMNNEDSQANQHVPSVPISRRFVRTAEEIQEANKLLMVSNKFIFQLSRCLLLFDVQTRKRTPKLTINDKVKIIYLHKHELRSYSYIGKIFSCTKSTISEIINNSNDILEKASKLSELKVFHDLISIIFYCTTS